MKTKLFLIINLIILSCATVPPEQLQKQIIIDLPAMAKNQIFKKSLEWIATSFQSYKAVTEYSDPESGKIIGNIVTTNTVLISVQYFKSKMTIEAKDNKARLTFNPFEVTIEDTTRGIYGEEEKNKAHESLNVLINSYTKFMKSNQKDSNW